MSQEAWTGYVTADRLAETIEYERVEATARMRRVVNAHHLPGAIVEALTGNAADATLEYAKDHHADLIVCGTHGRTGLGRLILGSVAEQIVRHAPCAVLTVKAPEPARLAAFTSSWCLGF